MLALWLLRLLPAYAAYAIDLIGEQLLNELAATVVNRSPFADPPLASSSSWSLCSPTQMMLMVLGYVYCHQPAAVPP